MLWAAHSHTGEYNDNMNSELVTLWVKQNSYLFCLKWNTPVKMVLVADNALYNYERKIGSLSAGIEKNSISHDKMLEKIGTSIVICTQLLICFVNYPLIVTNCGRPVWKIARTTFVSICEGIEEQIRLLVVDDTFRYDIFMLPIDILVVDLTKDFEEDVELFQSENI